MNELAQQLASHGILGILVVWLLRRDDQRQAAQDAMVKELSAALGRTNELLSYFSKRKTRHEDP